MRLSLLVPLLLTLPIVTFIEAPQRSVAPARTARPQRLPAAQRLQPPPPDPVRTGITVEVDPGMELLAIMAYLGQRYPAPLDSKYKSDVWAHFKAFRHHPALDSIRIGQLYPDFTELGLLLRGFPALRATIPDTSHWYGTYSRARIAAILNGAVRFAKDTRFAEFRRAHRANYGEWTSLIQTALTKDSVLQRVDRFYRAPSTDRTGVEVRLYLEPLNNWGAHQIDPGRLEGAPSDDIVRFQFGPDGDGALPDSPLLFSMDRRQIATVWHEAGHAFIRPLMREQAARIASLSRLFDSTNTNLKRQNVTTWNYAFEENLVRAAVAVMIGAAYGQPAMDAEIKSQVGGGFVLVPQLAQLLQREYVPQRDRYPSIVQFGGRIMEQIAAK
jgi:hypothetical protein